MLNTKVEPWLSEDSTDNRPPNPWTIFLQIANPIPVPAYWLAVCNLLNGSKMRLWYIGLMPIPLSATLKIHSSGMVLAET